MKAIKERLETFRLAIEELQAEFNYVSGSGNRNSAIALEQELSTANLRALLEESEKVWGFAFQATTSQAGFIVQRLQLIEAEHYIDQSP